MNKLNSRDRKFLGLIISIPVVWGLLSALWVDAASAADTTRTVRQLPNGKTETCVYETSFVTTRDGANVIRRAWRCEVK